MAAKKSGRRRATPNPRALSSGFGPKLAEWLRRNKLARKHGRQFASLPSSPPEYAAVLASLEGSCSDEAVRSWRDQERLPHARFIAHIERHMGAPWSYLDDPETEWPRRQWTRDDLVELIELLPEEVLDDVVSAVQKRIDEEVPPTALKPAEALERFLAYLLSIRRRPGTITFYRWKLAALVEAWRDIPMERWSPKLFRAFLASHGEWSDRQVQMLTNAAIRWIRWTKAEGIACGDFARGVEKPKVEQPESYPLTAAQLEAVLRIVRGHHYEVPVALAAYAGLSIGDLRALRWEEVDLRKRLIVRRRRKTGAPLYIPITDDLAEILGRWPGIRGPVCRRLPDGDNSLNQTLHRIFERAGVPKAPRGRNGWHRLRHTAASLLDAHGASVATIGMILGHKRGSATTLRYITPDVEKAREALARVSDSVRRSRVQ